MQPDLNAIERQHVELALSLGWKMFPYAAVGLPDSKQQWCPPGAEVHISTCRDLPTFDELLAHVRALEAERARLREAIDFYANEDRYDYDQTCCPSKSNPGRKEPDGGVLEDSGQRARAALDPNRSE
jgi:hypothetical protein